MNKLEIAIFLSRRRKNLGMTISALKKKSGLNYDQVQGILKGESNYTVNSLISMYKALDVKMRLSPIKPPQNHK